MRIDCEKCGVVGIGWPPKWAREEARQHAAKHVALGVPPYPAGVSVVVKVSKDREGAS